jgi:hypothetical protein
MTSLERRLSASSGSQIVKDCEKSLTIFKTSLIILVKFNNSCSPWIIFFFLSQKKEYGPHLSRLAPFTRQIFDAQKNI